MLEKDLTQRAPLQELSTMEGPTASTVGSNPGRLLYPPGCSRTSDRSRNLSGAECPVSDPQTNRLVIRRSPILHQEPEGACPSQNRQYAAKLKKPETPTPMPNFLRLDAPCRIYWSAVASFQPTAPTSFTGGEIREPQNKPFSLPVQVVLASVLELRKVWRINCHIDISTRVREARKS